ncbi:MAG: helix-turn-helix domain-containing protein [Actinomycetota bacterium]|nr:helix-turn-helix domain-containing protein [Actinomycetota bacterium]
MTTKRAALARARKAAGFTQETLADAVGVDPSTVRRWEVGSSVPQPWLRPKLATAFRLTLQELNALLESAGSSLETVAPSTLSFFTEYAVTEPVTVEYIDSIRFQMRHLLAMDAQFGGNEASVQAVRLFRSVHRRVGASPCPRSLQRDLYSTAGELAEIAGWLLYDADKQEEARRINQEALYYLRWAGDRSLELLTLQNMSMQAEYLDRPAEALNIAQSVMETDQLTPRVEALFLARSAHALAQQGQQGEANKAFSKAHNLFLDGPGTDDPIWAYWVDDIQFAWFEAKVRTAQGNHGRSVAIFADALAHSPKHRVRGLYSRTTYLLESLVAVGDWRQAEVLVPHLEPYIREVGSGRTTAILRRALRAIHAGDVPSNLRDGAVHLRGLLDGSL